MSFISNIPGNQNSYGEKKPSFLKSLSSPRSSFFSGTPERFEQRSLLDPEQQGLYRNLLGAGMGRGAGGAFGTAADYYRNLLSDNPEDLENFAAPDIRRFRQETIPDIAEQFAGLGSGGLSSSGFRNAAVGAGRDLSERIASIRASLRQGAVQGLQGIGQLGLGQYNENIFRPRQASGFEQLLPILTKIASSYFGGAV